MEGAYSVIGNVCHVRLVVSILANGDASGAVLIVRLPVPVAGRLGDTSVLAGRESAKSGKMRQALVAADTVTVYNYDNSYPGSDGAHLILNGSYECQVKP